ncbi:MAG: hypothetical protein H7293_20090 [Candidatus Saccharibacteria bacterium]|nr:hypothetical protein [Rhodoferax sp.]
MNTKSETLAELPSKGAYAKAWKFLKSMPVDGMVTLRKHESPKPVVYARAEFRKALDHRINARAGDYEANVGIDIELQRDARALDDLLVRRIRVYQFATPMMRERFGHLLSSHDD